MSPADWDLVVAWLELRWPTLNWMPATVAALYDDLAGYEMRDVWTALHGLYEEGRTHAPSPSVIVAAVRAARQYGWTEAKVALDGGLSITWAEWRDRMGFDTVEAAIGPDHIHSRAPEWDCETCRLRAGQEPPDSPEAAEVDAEARTARPEMVEALKEALATGKEGQR